MSGPLTGVSILAAEQMHALPHATQLLALLGAAVIKVEPLGGEAGRFGKPTVRDADERDTGMTFVRNNLGKASIALDLKAAAGRELFLKLAGTVDAVAENFRPGTADRLGIGWDAVHERNPAAIYVSVSGFGNRSEPPSPYREWAAYAPIVEGMAGLYEYSRGGDEPPQLALAGALGDTGPGLYAVIGLLAALHERSRTGVGRYVDVSMYDAMIAIADIVNPASMGAEPSRMLDGIGILHAFRAQDGWFSIEVVREPHFPRFAEAVGHPEWVDDPRLATREGWSEQMESVIRPGVEAWAASKTKLEASAELARRGVAAGPVNTAEDIRRDPHVRARDFVHSFAGADGGKEVAVVGNPVAFRGGPGEDAAPRAARWPVLAGDTTSILSGRLGLDANEIEELRAQGIIT
ncbi:MAG: CoA transferase [Deltaproteobacteria bacterium]|nr:CoA transferase [Deltaproteobacteria bacterium]MBW2359963.1 CoA transferase [Deltaproteobacteria bacterium]